MTDDVFCERDRLRDELERVQVMLADAERRFTEARAEIARLRDKYDAEHTRFVLLDAAVKAIQEKRQQAPGMKRTGLAYEPADGGQKTLEGATNVAERADRMSRVWVKSLQGKTITLDELVTWRSMLEPAIPPRAASGGEAKDAKEPPERVVIAWHPYTMAPHQAYIVRHGFADGWSGIDYVRADVADDLLAALRRMVDVSETRGHSGPAEDHARDLIAKLGAGRGE